MKTLDQKLTKWGIILIITLFSITAILYIIIIVRDIGKPKTVNVVYNQQVSETYTNVTVKKLYSDYSENVANADELYKGKLLQISGRVASISNDFGSGYYLNLETENEFLPIACHFDSNVELKDLKVGGLVVVRGRCEGETVYIYIKNCEIMK